MVVSKYTCLLCPNPVPSYLVEQGWTICNDCYHKYADHIKKFVPIGTKLVYKPVILDREYFERSPVFTENPEPITYFVVPEQIGFAVDEWMKLTPLTKQMRYMGQVLEYKPVNQFPQEPKSDIVKSNKRKIDV